MEVILGGLFFFTVVFATFFYLEKTEADEDRRAKKH